MMARLRSALGALPSIAFSSRLPRSWVGTTDCFPSVGILLLVGDVFADVERGDVVQRGRDACLIEPGDEAQALLFVPSDG